MDWKEAEEVIKSLEKGSELIEAITARVTEERRDASNKANGEAKGLRKQRDAIKARLSKVEETLGVEFADADDEDFESALGQVGAKVKASGEPGKNIKEHPEFLQLKSEYDKQRKTFEKLKSDHDSLTEKQYRSEVRSQLSKALNEGELKVAPEFTDVLVGHLSGNIQRSEGGDGLIFRDGENVVSISDGVQGYLKVNQHFVKTDQRPGGGSGNQGGKGGGPNNAPTPERLGQMSMEEYRAYRTKQAA